MFKKQKYLPYSMVLLLALYQGNALSQVSIDMKAGRSPTAIEVEKMFSVSPGSFMRLENMKIDDKSPSFVSMDLQRIEVVDDTTEIIVQSGDMVHVKKSTPRAHFSGKLDGDKGSFVFLAIDEQGEVRSIIHQGDQIIVNEAYPASSQRQAGQSSRKVDHEADFINRDFSCGLDAELIDKGHTSTAETFRKMVSTAIENQSTTKASAQATQRRADIIIETDYEYYQKFNNATTAYNYTVDLLAYISAKYQQEIGTRFLIKQINIYSTAADPWTQTTPNGQLNEVQAYWNSSSRAATPRHHVHFLSGKNTGGGVAYLNTLGYSSYAYGISGNIEGKFTPANPQIVWDSVVVAHEMGHAFGSSHTQSFDNPYLGSNLGGAIDCCYSSSTGQCATQLGGTGRYGVLPGVGSTKGGIVGQKNGTIMSYCHLLQPGIGNINFTFGANQVYGVNPGRVASVMQASAQTYLPIDSVSTTAYDLLVSKSGAGTGTIASSPAGISCGTDCTESYAANTAITLTAVASSGSAFTGWSGHCAGTTSTCSVTMGAARNVTASFATTPSRLVTLAKSGTGLGTIASSPSGMSCGTSCGSASVSFPSTNSVALGAVPATGSTFAGWSGGTCSGTTSCLVPAGTSSVNVTATFNPVTSTSAVVTLLQNTGLSGATNSTKLFAIQVPTGGRNLVISTLGGTGDVDLYVKAGAAPTTSSFDCSPYLQGNAEQCTLSSPKAGIYYISLYGSVAYSGVTLKATWTAGKAVQADGTAPTNTGAAQIWVSGPAQ